MEFQYLSPLINEASTVLSNINAVFKDKDLETVMREGSVFKREMLAESVFSLKKALSDITKVYQECNSKVSPTNDYVKKDEFKDMLTSLIPMISQSVKEALQGPEQQKGNDSSTHTIMSVPPVKPSENMKKSDHVVLLHGEVGEDNFSGFDDHQWNTVVKKKLGSKLKSIPIKNSVKTKDGKACLFVESEETMNQVKAALKDDYNVELSKPKSNSLYPKVKMYNIDTSVYNKDNKEQLNQSGWEQRKPLSMFCMSIRSNSIYEKKF